MTHYATQAVLELGILLLQPLILSASITELSHHSRLRQCNDLLGPEVLSDWEAEAGGSVTLLQDPGRGQKQTQRPVEA